MAPTRRASLLLLALVAFLATSVLAQASNTTISFTNITSTEKDQCGACRDKKDCAQAYKGSPGLYCGNFLNDAKERMPCCCPQTGECARVKGDGALACTCSTVKSAASSVSSSLAIWTVVGTLSAVVALRV